MGIAFTYPIALSLLILVVAFVLIDRHGLRVRSRGRRYLLLGIRILSFSAIVMALANPVVWTGANTLSTVFLLDRSASVSPATQQKAVSWIQQAIQSKRRTDRAAVISFGGNAAVEQGLSTAPAAVDPTAKLDQNHTDIAAALRLAEGVLPSSGARRIVLLSDGNQNVGQALNEVPTLRAAGIPVDVVPLTAQNGPEVALRQISVPPAIHQGERFTLNVTIASTVETTAQLRLLIDGRLDSTRNLALHVGDNSLVLAHDPLPPGQHTFEAIVEPAQDTLSENNVGYATLQIAGPPRVLLVEADPQDSKYLAAALRAGGLAVDVESPSILSSDVGTLRKYDAIGLVNVPATRIGAAGLIALRSYVQDFGGGLVAIGGDRSFGVGAYRKTPLEDALPVSMDVRGRQARTSVAMVLVIDTSGSMSEGPPGATKIELARTAALGATEQLSSQDQIGIVAFDETPHWIFPTQFLTDPATLRTDIGKLQAGGGTQIYPALLQAYNDLVNRQAKVKHILLMTDGLSPSGDYAGLTAKMRANGITLSTIAIGTDADVNFLQNLADAGRGRFYDASNPADVPAFVVKETTLVARAAITEETFVPTKVDQTPILNGINTIPALRGYVATTPKPSAIVGLESPQQDPILAQWQFGLGRAVAFTSDVTGGWSADWVSWNDFSRFWTQTFKWVVPSPQGQNLQVNAAVANGKATIQVDALGQDGRYVNGTPTTATVASPNGAMTKVALTQVAPGRYETTIPADQQGSYLVQVTQSATNGGPPVTQVYGFTVPYSPEFAELPTSSSFLQELAKRTNGTVLTSPTESFVHNLRPTESAQPIWPDLIALLIPLFLLDVAIRRLRISPSYFAPIATRIRARWHGPTGRAALFANRLVTARKVSRTSARPGLQLTAVATRRASLQPQRSSPAPRAAPLRREAAPSGIPPSSRLLAAKRRAAPAPRPSPR